MIRPYDAAKDAGATRFEVEVPIGDTGMITHTFYITKEGVTPEQVVRLVREGASDLSDPTELEGLVWSTPDEKDEKREVVAKWVFYEIDQVDFSLDDAIKFVMVDEEGTIVSIDPTDGDGASAGDLYPDRPYSEEKDGDLQEFEVIIPLVGGGRIMRTVTIEEGLDSTIEEVAELIRRRFSDIARLDEDEGRVWLDTDEEDVFTGDDEDDDESVWENRVVVATWETTHRDNPDPADVKIEIRACDSNGRLSICL